MIKTNRGKFKDTTKEERARVLKNIICPKCGYQNHEVFIKNMVDVIFVKQY